jgi:hypothetical protein
MFKVISVPIRELGSSPSISIKSCLKRPSDVKAVSKTFPIQYTSYLPGSDSDIGRSLDFRMVYGLVRNLNYDRSNIQPQPFIGEVYVIYLKQLSEPDWGALCAKTKTFYS